MSKSKGIKTCLIIISIIVILMIASISVWSIMKQDFNKTYTVKFYVNDNLIEEVEKQVYERISDAEIIEINRKINNPQNEDYFIWSLNKDTLKQVDFNAVYTDTNVYLHKKANEIKIDIKDSDDYKYYIEQKDIIRYNDTIKICIEQIIDKDKYKMFVEADGELLEPNHDGFYYIKDVKENVKVDVYFKKIIRIVPQLDGNLVYNGQVQYFPYEIMDGDNNLIETDMMTITYLNEEGNEIDGMIDASKYTVNFSYKGDEYYFIDTSFETIVDKKTPSLEVLKGVFGYRGITQYFDESYILTDSDGLITFENNVFTGIGEYSVVVNIEETTNFTSLNETISIKVVNGVVEIMEMPSVSLGYEGENLNSVVITGGKTNTPGTFRWKENSTIDANKSTYKMLFVPNDLNEFEILEFDYVINVISYEETLRRIRIDRNQVYTLLESSLSGVITKINELPLYATEYRSTINWLSSSTILRVNDKGEAVIIGDVGIYKVTLIGYMMLGSTAEYLRFDFEIEIEETNKVEKPNKPLYIIPKLNLQKYEQQRFNSESVDKQVYVYTDKIDYQPHRLIVNESLDKVSINLLDVYIETEKQKVEYKTRWIDRSIISEIILWKIVSDSAGEGAHNYKIETKQIRYINFMKGEK